MGLETIFICFTTWHIVAIEPSDIPRVFVKSFLKCKGPPADPLLSKNKTKNKVCPGLPRIQIKVPAGGPSCKSADRVRTKKMGGYTRSCTIRQAPNNTMTSKKVKEISSHI